MRPGERLRFLRTAFNMTQRELAEKLSISPSTIGMYEQNRRMPDAETLSFIADLFGVSVDYLLGNKPASIDNKNFYFYFFFDCWDGCVKRIRSLLNEMHLSEEEFCHELNIDLNGEILVSDLIRIARRLNVSTDYLLGNSMLRYISEDDLSFANSLSTRERNVIDTFRLLDTDNQDIMVGELKKCLKEQRQEAFIKDPPVKEAK